MTNNARRTLGEILQTLQKRKREEQLGSIPLPEQRKISIQYNENFEVNHKHNERIVWNNKGQMEPRTQY